MDAIQKIEEAKLPTVLYHQAEPDGTFLPSESCVCEDDVYTNNGDDDTIGVPLVLRSDALQLIAARDAETERLKAALGEIVAICPKDPTASLHREMAEIARAALNPTQGANK